MADTLDALTLPEGKRVVGVASSDTTKDERLAQAITAVSRRLDQGAGPVVRRTITAEIHDGGCRSIELAWCPVFSVSSVVEYQGTSSTTLTEETIGTEPSQGWLGVRYTPDRSLYSGIIVRRSSGSDAWFEPGRNNVSVTYSAGRSTSTETVDARFKEAAAVMLRNWWRADEQSIASMGEYDVPRQSFPTFAVPKAVRDLLADVWQDEDGFGA